MIAVISDIHANLPALEAVLREIGDVDEILCAGDLVGYNPWPNEVISMVRERGIRCILGNHDRAILRRDFSYFNPIAVEACQWTLEHLTPESLEFLASLPENMILDMDDSRIAVHHGSPWDEDMYVYPDMVDESFLEKDGADILIMGHTHVPFIAEFPSGKILNPGSVGQPRDGDPRASYAIIDEQGIEIRRVDYDIDRVYKEILRSGLPEVLGERLYFGR